MGILQVHNKRKELSLPKLLQKAQITFNAFIRARDQHKGCISCSTGKVEQAGHFYNAGQYSALRFNESNCNGQCIQCNYYKSGNLNEYRIRLIQRIGEQNVLLLDLASKNRVKKWSRVELLAIIQEYKLKQQLI